MKMIDLEYLYKYYTPGNYELVEGCYKVNNNIPSIKKEVLDEDLELSEIEIYNIKILDLEIDGSPL